MVGEQRQTLQARGGAGQGLEGRGLGPSSEIEKKAG